MQFLVCSQYLSVKAEWDQRCRHLAPPCSCDPDTGSPDQSWAAYHDHDHGNQTLDESAPLNDWLGQTTLDTNLVSLDYITSWMRLHCFEGISALITDVALKALYYCEDNDAPIWYWNFNLSSSRGFINVLTFVFHSRLLQISLQFWCKLCRKSSVVYLHYITQLAALERPRLDFQSVLHLTRS